MSLEDIKLLTLVENGINELTGYDIAKIVYYLYKDDYVCGKLKNKLWYHYEDHKWKQTELGPYKELSTNIVKLFEDYKNEDDAINNKVDAIIFKLKNVSFKESVCRECTYLFYDSDFIINLDRNINLICFNNGVWDIRNKTFRDGLKSDKISLSIGKNYNDVDDKIDYIINQFIQFRKKILEKRSPNHIFKIKST
jgi:hypothetical protein|tara:strand:+ start:528 stop:1112 length:585 start_codon:yes stop_codon:yes gene_type:complete